MTILIVAAVVYVVIALACAQSLDIAAIAWPIFAVVFAVMLIGAALSIAWLLLSIRHLERQDARRQAHLEVMP